jgi:hypothetical protein
MTATETIEVGYRFEGRRLRDEAGFERGVYQTPAQLVTLRDRLGRQAHPSLPQVCAACSA